MAVKPLGPAFAGTAANGRLRAPAKSSDAEPQGGHHPRAVRACRVGAASG